MRNGPYEQQLGELKALTYEVGKSTQLVLKRIREARGLLAAHGPLLAFVHIPKTAGGTATTMLARAYSSAAIHDAGNYMRRGESLAKALTGPRGGWQSWHRNGGRVSVGHVPYGVFREFLPEGSRYMTFLREPVDRVLSHYYRHVHHPNLTPTDRAERRQAGRAAAGSLEEALVDLQLPQLNNLATRFLCSHSSPMGELPTSALEDAKANLRAFGFVGIQERFEESLVLLQRTLGLELVPYMNRHVSVEGARPSVDEISDAERALIEEHNRLDVELYEFALELFEDALAAADERLAADVERLRTSSADLNEQAIETARVWLDRDAPAGGIETGTLRTAAREAGVPIPALKRVVKELPLTHRVFLPTGYTGQADPGHEPGPPLAFVHVPRTSGATVQLVFADAYTARAVRDVGGSFRGDGKPPVKLAGGSSNWAIWQRRGGRVVSGHVPYAVLRQHLPADTRYMTFMREPVDRVLSHYYSQVHHPELSQAECAEREEQGQATAASLEEALVDMRLPELCNLATRFLASDPSSIRDLPARALDAAKANLRELAFVGLQERFDESIVLLRRMLALDPAPHLNANVSVDRPAVDEVSDEHRALIAEHNQLDAELYTFALGLFEDAVAAADEGFASDAEALRASSAKANEDALELARDFLDRELPPGATKRKREIFAAAREAGVPMETVKYTAELVSVSRRHQDDGGVTWTRSEAAADVGASREPAAVTERTAAGGTR